MKRVFTLTIECNPNASGVVVRSILEEAIRGSDPHGYISYACHVDTIKLSERKQEPRKKKV